ncbi:MAG: 16S rRNA (uracil(1498)-N(3))-methyltransferase [Gammaproteobacteria bacterium]|nr:16S rRNA (uracil(1498)-N(3))-methyltransferase [Gammaproteobacteria bacterium]
MPLRRIFSDEPLQGSATVTLHGDAAGHVQRVLRLRRGDAVVLFDGSGSDFEGEITALARDAVTVAVGVGREVVSESPLAITLLQGVCRGTRMDTVVQKATELGVAEIRPVLTSRSVVRLDEARGERRQSHWQRVAVAAAEQSGRSRVPAVAEAAPLEAALAAVTSCPTRLLLDPMGAALRDMAIAPGALALLVGPEGGLAPEEVRLAGDCGFRPVRLGPRILRTETAPLAALALLQFLAGDL